MILSQLPDLPPRPETPRNSVFRRNFYARWGQENSIIAGRSRRAEYAPYKQTLSIKTVAHGSEHYFFDRRRLTVTDETYLVLNADREYASVLESPREAYSFCIFFRPQLASEVAHAMRSDIERTLEEEGEYAGSTIEFRENLRPHDRSVTPVLNYIRRHVLLGVDDQSWYDEQFNFLLTRLLRADGELGRMPERLTCISRSRRDELIRRLNLATDFMHCNLDRELTLQDIAQAARISHYHFVRLFRQVHGVTPMSYLRRQRTQRALALLTSTDASIQEIASRVGFSRLALWRNVARVCGEGPLRMRERQHRDSSQVHEPRELCI